jgi:hypothetical protein
MARKLRVEYPGAVYHVMNRGDPREATFRMTKTEPGSLPTLAEAYEKASWEVHAYCLINGSLFTHFVGRRRRVALGFLKTGNATTEFRNL